MIRSIVRSTKGRTCYQSVVLRRAKMVNGEILDDGESKIATGKN